MANLRGKIAVVTGASRGVGRGIAQGLGEAGATVYVTGRSRSRRTPAEGLTIDAAARDIDELGGHGIPVEVDHGDDAQIKGLFERIRSEQGRLDVLVNNVFKIPDPPVFGGGFWTHPVSIWDDMVGIGCRAHYVASVYGAPMMVEQGSGLVVNISSGGAAQYLFSVAYGTGKCAVDRMSRDMAVELEDHGVAALSLWPGTVKTEFLLQAVEEGKADLDMSEAETPRFSGRAVAALASDRALMSRSGQVWRAAQLAQDYGFTDVDGRVPTSGLSY